MPEKTINKPGEILRGRVMPLLPLRDVVVFPGMVIPLFVGRAKSIASLEMALEKDKKIFLVTQKDASVENPSIDDMHVTGTISRILQVLKLPDNALKVLVDGIARADMIDYPETGDAHLARVIIRRSRVKTTSRRRALVKNVGSLFETYVKLNPKVPSEVLDVIQGVEESGKLADMIAAQLQVKLETRQELLSILNTNDRLERLAVVMSDEIEILEIEKRIQGKIRKQVEKSQKDFYLNEQLKAIQAELGAKENSEIIELREKVKKSGMHEQAHEKAMSEIGRLEKMPMMTAEATVVRNYIDWLTSLPWKKATRDMIDLDSALRILDEDHHGLEKVKERILEFLAVRKLVKKTHGPILCLVGPPGVGKTSLAQSVARAMGRKFVRISLGGVRDEAEIRGHRRTYIGAMPGRIIQLLKRAGTINPVLLMDEVDKMSTDFRGDPSAALLEVLDPEINSSFNDHYLEVDYDLSNVLFFTTANTLHGIPDALRDRLEIIRLPGYTSFEKQAIATRFLVPRQLKEHGLKSKKIRFSPGALNAIISGYTREAGVRNLEREIASICRKMARKTASSKSPKSFHIMESNLKKWIGAPRFMHTRAAEKDEVGVATGLAWTAVGGELLNIEVTTVKGREKLILTGQLGDVMKESARTALSHARSRASDLGVDPSGFTHREIHIHIPEGAVPKDGPSAGAAMAVAIVSALTDSPVRKDTAMTGEITLRGRVFPVGGIKEKVLAAHRSGIKHVLMPEENRKDMEEIPDYVRNDLLFHFVSNMDEVFAHCFSRSDRKIARRKTRKSRQVPTVPMH